MHTALKAVSYGQKIMENKMSNSQQIQAYIDRIEHQEAILDDEKNLLKDIYSEMKSQGYEISIIKRIISLRKKTADTRAEEQMLLETYMSAIGME
jgi:uncharacterized protein (UPF0335 family)